MVRHYRKVIRIRATDSPNVRLALEEIARGCRPAGGVLVNGLLPYDEYLKRRATWDPIRQKIGLDAEFYVGAELLLFPPDWLNGAEERARELGLRWRKAEAIGIDPAEGGDKTAMAAVDRKGLVKLVSRQTPDTTDITKEAVAFMREYQCPTENVVFDRGGGGKQHADRLRKMGYNVRTVAFGESLVPDPKRAKVSPLRDRLDQREDRYAYRNRRAEMYGELSQLLDPSLIGDNRNGGYVFAIPANYADLRKQLAVFPRMYDDEGRMVLPPKNKKDKDSESKRKTLTELIGHSPDEADALALAVHGMLHKPKVAMAGVF